MIVDLVVEAERGGLCFPIDPADLEDGSEPRTESGRGRGLEVRPRLMGHAAGNQGGTEN